MREAPGQASLAAAVVDVGDESGGVIAVGGEVLGKKIRVRFGDHRHNIDVASTLVTQWFSDEYVGAIFDMPNSSIALACQKLAAERNRPRPGLATRSLQAAASRTVQNESCTHLAG